VSKPSQADKNAGAEKNIVIPAFRRSDYPLTGQSAVMKGTQTQGSGFMDVLPVPVQPG
jgi:hypothetical protein